MSLQSWRSWYTIIYLCAKWSCLIRTVDRHGCNNFLACFMHCWQSTLLVIYEQLLVLGRTFNTFISKQYMRSLLRKKQELFLFFIHSQDVHQVFMEEVKKTAWEAWKCFPDATSSFIYMQSNAFTTSINPDDTHQFKLLEHFCAAMYDKTSSQSSVDEVRKELICHTMEFIPPIQDALLQHTRRAAYQSQIWCTSDELLQDIYLALKV